MAHIGENKSSTFGGAGMILDVSITILGIAKNIYETVGKSRGGSELGTRIDVYAENLTYKAPDFTSGEFNITMYHTENDSNFTKSVKVLYPNGKIEIYKLKSGNQLKLTEAGTIIDLNPDAKSVSEQNPLYITQSQLDEGKTGVVMNQAETAFVEKASGQNPRLVDAFYKKKFGENSLDGFKGLGVDRFSYLTEEEKKLATLTSKPVSKDVLDNYVKNDPKARADFYDRLSDILPERTNVLKTSMELPFIKLNGGKPYQITPYKKGTNKVIVKTGSKYLSGKEGDPLQYSDSIGDDEVFDLVLMDQKSSDDKVQFRLNNKNGVSLIGNAVTRKFGTDKNLKSEIRFSDKSNNEIHNWLIEWYPGKENERQKYDEIEIIADEKDPTKYRAKDSSGNVIKNSWVNRDNEYYFVDAEGVILTGWQEIKGKTYYFSSPYGYMVTTGSDSLIEGKYYYFNDDGVLQRSTWRGENYSDASGAFVKEGLKAIDGKIYYFQNSYVNKKEVRIEDQNVILHFSDKGVLERVSNLKGEVINSVVNVQFDNKTLAFNKDGSILKTGITKIANTIAYYSLEDGASYTGWKMIGGKRYYFTNGYNTIFNNYENIDGKRYYFHEDGSVNRAGFEKIDGKLYHFDNNGVAQTGWQTIDNKYYYFDENGAAKTGWFQVGGGYRPWPPAYGYLWYCAREDGSLYADGWFKIGGKDYQFDQWGHKM